MYDILLFGDNMQNQINMDDQNGQQIGQAPISQPTQILGKPKINYFVISAVILACFLLFGFGGYYFGKQPSKTRSEEQNQPTPSPTTTKIDSTTSWKSYIFQPLLLSLKVPSELTVHTQESNPGNDFTAYIQNYPFNAPVPSENAYQLYIIWQKTPTVTQTEFQQLKNDLDINSVENIVIAGYPAIKGQVKGERNRFVVYILKGDTKISLFTSEPTQINKNLTDQILSTFEFFDKLLPTPETTNPLISIPYNPKADWQIYTDEIAKFSLQYNTIPTQQYNSHQSLGNNQAGKSVMIMSCNTPPNKQEVCLEQYTITVYTNYTGGSRRDWMSKNIHDYPNCQRYYADVSVAGKNALLATSNCSSWGETYILIPNGSQMIVLLTKGYSRNDTTGKITLTAWVYEALSTFKFNQ